MTDETIKMPGLKRAAASPQGNLRVELGVHDGAVVFQIGQIKLRMTADQADQMSADLRMYALELRNGGQVK